MTGQGPTPPCHFVAVCGCGCWARGLRLVYPDMLRWKNGFSHLAFGRRYWSLLQVVLGIAHLCPLCLQMVAQPGALVLPVFSLLTCLVALGRFCHILGPQFPPPPFVPYCVLDGSLINFGIEGASLSPSLLLADFREPGRREETPNCSWWTHHSQLFLLYRSASWRSTQLNINEIKTYNGLVGAVFIKHHL